MGGLGDKVSFMIIRDLEVICHSPINDSLLVQELQSGDNFGGIETSPGLWEPATRLYVEHQIATIQVFHHKKQVTLKGQMAKFNSSLIEFRQSLVNNNPTQTIKNRPIFSIKLV